MRSIDVHEAKTHFLKLLAEVESGKTVIVCRDGRPVAELRPAPRAIDPLSRPPNPALRVEVSREEAVAPLTEEDWPEYAR